MFSQNYYKSNNTNNLSKIISGKNYFINTSKENLTMEYNNFDHLTFNEIKIFRIDQITNKNFLSPLFQFCAFLAEKINYDKIILLNGNSQSFNIDQRLHDSLPLIVHQFINFEYWEKTKFHRLIQLLSNIPYIVLFFHVPNLINLKSDDKERIINRTTEVFSEKGVTIDQIGWSYQSYGQSGLILVVSANDKISKSPPNDFNVVAIIAVRNEEDIIKQTIEYLYSQGVLVYIIDNWSTDDSIQKIEHMIGKEIIGIEKWPKDNPPKYFSLEGILKRKEQLSKELDADWFLHYDTDEIRESPWINTTLREGLWRVENNGYNAVDFTLLNFRPTDNSYKDGDSLIDFFSFCEFGDRPGHFKQIKAWKKQSEKVDLHSQAGHKVIYPNQKVFPIKFLTRHYPFRSQIQAEKKIIKDRINRLDPEGLKKGWHTHYKNFDLNHDILKRKEELIDFDQDFYTDYLIERLSGIGIKTNFKNIEQTKPVPIELKTKVKDLENEVLFYAQSKSWNFTRPIRKLFKTIRSIFINS